MLSIFSASNRKARMVQEIQQYCGIFFNNHSYRLLFDQPEGVVAIFHRHMQKLKDISFFNNSCLNSLLILRADLIAPFFTDVVTGPGGNVAGVLAQYERLAAQPVIVIQNTPAPAPVVHNPPVYVQPAVVPLPLLPPMNGGLPFSPAPVMGGGFNFFPPPMHHGHGHFHPDTHRHEHGHSHPGGHHHGHH